MTPAELASLHAACFTTPRPFTAREFQDFLASDHVFLCSQPIGFALGRVVVDEVELITLAVAPEARREGVGRALLSTFEETARERGAGYAFLEVASDNIPARALYRSAGYAESGRRRAYYRKPDGQSVDAILMSKQLTTS